MPRHSRARCSKRSSAPKLIQARRRRGGGKATASFAVNTAPSRTARATLRRELQATTTALRRTTAALRRAEAARVRTDTRAWMQDRRARTRRLIELGGLVQKSGLPARLAAAEAEDERAVILGALLTLSRVLATPNPTVNAADLIARWRAAGRAALRSSDPTNTEPTV